MQDFWNRLYESRRQWVEAANELTQLPKPDLRRELELAFADPTKRRYALMVMSERPAGFEDVSLDLVLDEALTGMRDVPACMTVLQGWDRSKVVEEVKARVARVLDKQDEWEAWRMFQLLETFGDVDDLERFGQELEKSSRDDLLDVAAAVQNLIRGDGTQKNV